MIIRRATKEDAHEVVPLVNIILEDMEIPILKEIPLPDLFKVLELAFETEDYRYSYGRVQIADIDGKVAGVAFGYPDEDEGHIDHAMSQFFPQIGLPESTEFFPESEVLPGEWYLDTLAVSPDFQGQGIGTTLLESLPEVARAAGKNKIGLNVDVGNPKAEKLYTKMGFKTIGNMVISGHDYHHMQKDI